MFSRRLEERIGLALLDVKKNGLREGLGASPTGVGVALESAWTRYNRVRADGDGHKTDVAVSALRVHIACATDADPAVWMRKRSKPGGPRPRRRGTSRGGSVREANESAVPAPPGCARPLHFNRIQRER